MSSYPDIGVGDLVTADLLVSMLPQFVRKASDQAAAASSTVLANDSELFLPVVASASYFYEGWLMYSATSNTPDMKLNYSYPAGATLTRSDWGLQPGTVAIADSVEVTTQTTGDSTRGAGSAATIIRTIYAQGELVVGVTAGTFQVRFAQNTSDVAILTRRAGSRIKLTRYA